MRSVCDSNVYEVRTKRLTKADCPTEEIKGGDSFFEYVDTFVALVSRVDLPDEDQIAMFIKGLKPGNQKLITILGPKNL